MILLVFFTFIDDLFYQKLENTAWNISRSHWTRFSSTDTHEERIGEKQKSRETCNRAIRHLLPGSGNSDLHRQGVQILLPVLIPHPERRLLEHLPVGGLPFSRRRTNTETKVAGSSTVSNNVFRSIFVNHFDSTKWNSIDERNDDIIRFVTWINRRGNFGLCRTTRNLALVVGRNASNN